MVLHWGKILCYTKSCDYATLKAEKVQYLGSRLPNGATRKTEIVQYLGSRLPNGTTRKTEIVQYLGSRLPNGTTRKTEIVQYLGSRLRRELALQGNKLQAVDIEQTDVATLYGDKPFFDKLGEGANRIGSAHVAECSQFATCEMRQHI